MAERGRVCVTGGSGFIGSWLVRLLLDRGYSVNATVQHLGDERETKHLQSLEGAESRLQLFEIDVVDYNSLLHPIRGTVGVFHLASPNVLDRVQDPQRELLHPAVQGTINVLEAAKACGVDRVVVTSSTAAIIPSPGWPADAIKGEDCWTDEEFCRQNEVSKCVSERGVRKYLSTSFCLRTPGGMEVLEADWLVYHTPPTDRKRIAY